jgi:carbon-monoxide dehydrogenase large subunit
VIGAPVRRLEDARLLTGQGQFVADLERPRMLHVAFLRSPHAHARILRLNREGARSVPGVAACFDGHDLANRVRPMRAPSRMKGYRPTEFPALARGKVRHVGEAVAAVVAASRYDAEDATERIHVDYEPLPVVADPEVALADGGPLVHEDAASNVLLSRTFGQGDVAAAFRDATVVGDRFRFHRHAGVAIENRACLAEYQSGAGLLTLWSSTQIPGIVRDALADLLSVPSARIRVVAPDVGGGFGLKTVLYPEEIAVCALAMALGRPVKWVGDRREDLLSSTQAWDEIVEAELGLSADGTIVGLRARVVADVGAYSIYPWTASIEVIQVVSFLPGPYRVPHYHAEAFGVATNKAPMGPYRGVGRPISTFVTEALLDRGARRLGLDPVDVRRRNLLRPDEFPYRAASGIVWDSGAFLESLEKACGVANYDALRAEQTRARAGPPGRRDTERRLGIGVSCYVELTGVGSAIPVSPGADIATGTEGATVRVDAGGGVTALFGLASHGQGLETTLAQVVASELGVSTEQVRVLVGDTSIGPPGTGTYASRSAVLGGGAAILAARAVREKALTIAARELEAAPEDLDLVAGVVRVRGVPDRALSLARIATLAYGGTKRLPPGMEPGLEATRFYDPYFGTAAGATHLAVVEVDLATCAVAVLRYVVVEDCGRIINPLIVEGQAMGGVLQGIGAALLEEVVYGEDGQLLTGTLMDYLVPTAMEAPSVEVVHVERPSPTTLGGFKGVGEGGTIGAPAAIANAVADALAPLGVEVRELPMTSERLFRLLRAAPAPAHPGR